MSVVCPKCGVAVVPGYVKCPKCQTLLPQRRSTAVSAGGTSSSGGSGLSPAMILLAIAVLGGGIAIFVLSKGGDKPAVVETTAPALTPQPPVERPAVVPDEGPGPAPVQPVVKDPTVAVRDLDRALKKERLWGTVEVVGQRVDVRSSACGDATMTPVLDAALPALEEAGVTKIRCLEQAGAVVFERDLAGQ